MSPTDDEFDQMVDLCRKAHDIVVEYGTPEMQAFSSALLHSLGKEAARRALGAGNGYAE